MCSLGSFTRLSTKFLPRQPPDEISFPLLCCRQFNLLNTKKINANWRRRIASDPALGPLSLALSLEIERIEARAIVRGRAFLPL